MTTVGEDIQNEIERVSRKHERWLGYMRADPTMVAGMQLGAGLMKTTIDEAKAAVSSGDPIRVLRSYEALKAYDDND